MLKKYADLRNVDVSQWVEQRDGADYLNWAKVVGADGYRIYYSVDEDFETVKKVTVKPGDEVSKVIKGLKKGKKYYFRVRAFKKVNGKNVWGKYSNTKSVRVK